jgi:hypothetical protein
VPTLDSQIFEAFLARLEESNQVGDSLVRGLSEILSGDRLPTAATLVELYAAGREGVEA